tara:strand:- start:85 stop:546 length:462 start_codon:yes stop_codon:yes gene_type:complete
MTNADRKAKLDAIQDDAILEALPHGSGIDSDWTVDRCKNGTIRCRNSWHAMNDAGYYCGHYDFTVHIFAHADRETHLLKGPALGKVQVLHDDGDIDMRVTSSDIRDRGVNYGIKDYLGEIIHQDLSDAKILTVRTWSDWVSDHAQSLGQDPNC